MAEGGQRHHGCLDMKRRITYEEALNRIAERTSDNVRELRKSRFQRRTEFTDLYGIPFYFESDNDRAEFYISISPDLVYFMRFQFKLQIIGTSSDEFEISIGGVDITDYLITQHEGEWIDGEGLYPTDALEEQTDFYDVLAVAQDIYNEGDTEEKTSDSNKLLRPGFKKVLIKSDSSFSGVLYLYAKYSNVGR